MKKKDVDIETQILRRKISERLSPAIDIKVDGNKFSFPNMSNDEIHRLIQKVSLSPDKSVVVFAGNSEVILKVNEHDKLQLVIPKK